MRSDSRRDTNAMFPVYIFPYCILPSTREKIQFLNE